MKIIYLCILSLLLLSCTSPKSKTRFIDVSERGYSHSVEIDMGTSKMVILSGQIAVDEEGKIVGTDNFEKQTDQVFRNIKSLVEKSGGTMDNLIKIDCYFTDISRLADFRKIRDRYINAETPPTSTAVEVTRLINGDLMIEIGAIAVIEK
ncbi:RidA family protein [Sinomicrobium sp. M5D2P17]